MSTIPLVTFVYCLSAVCGNVKPYSDRRIETKALNASKTDRCDDICDRCLKCSPSWGTPGRSGAAHVCEFPRLLIVCVAVARRKTVGLTDNCTPCRAERDVTADRTRENCRLDY